MRYIRIKDGKILDLEQFENQTAPAHKDIMFLIDKEKICDYTIFTKDIIKQSDAIEELCDCLIYIQPNHQPSVMFVRSINYYLNDESWKNSFIRNIKAGFKYYAAIWTEDGLKYVAKINEKGKLKLI